MDPGYLPGEYSQQVWGSCPVFGLYQTGSGTVVLCAYMWSKGEDAEECTDYLRLRAGLLHILHVCVCVCGGGGGGGIRRVKGEYTNYVR